MKTFPHALHSHGFKSRVVFTLGIRISLKLSPQELISFFSETFFYQRTSANQEKTLLMISLLFSIYWIYRNSEIFYLVWIGSSWIYWMLYKGISTNLSIKKWYSNIGFMNIDCTWTILQTMNITITFKKIFLVDT